MLVFCSACGQGGKEAGEESADAATAPAEAAAETASGSGEGVPWAELSTEQQARVIDGILQAKAREQAEGLGGGSVVVNGAWHYTGYSYLSPDPDAAIPARLVAVDITVSGHRPAFDLDDIEIVDAETLVSFGSDPHIEPLTLEGEPMPAGQWPAPAPRAARYLLIYGFPKNLDVFRLYYWGRQLTAQPETVASAGWELSYPEAVAEPVAEMVAEGGDAGTAQSPPEAGATEAQPETPAKPETRPELKPGEGLFSR